MLGRTLPVLTDFVSRQHTQKLESSLSSFTPPHKADFRSLGQHLIYCNAAEPSDELLPDGLDALHSPGTPYVRRLWAGGSLRLDVPRHYSMGMVGWRFNREIVGVERIKNVRRRQRAGDDEKVFVNIERRFTRATGGRNRVRPDGSIVPIENGLATIPDLLRRQAQEEQEWGDATIVEERELVFMRERNAVEIEAFRAGQIAPLRYLNCWLPNAVNLQQLLIFCSTQQT
jgi:hydroxyacyl-ACP dehydratase HTD2-like protein with hotdog domain